MNTQTITKSPVELWEFLTMNMVKRPKTGFRPVTVSNRLRVNVSPDLMQHLKRLGLVTTLNRMTYAARDKREALRSVLLKAVRVETSDKAEMVYLDVSKEIEATPSPRKFW